MQGAGLVPVFLICIKQAVRAPPQENRLVHGSVSDDNRRQQHKDNVAISPEAWVRVTNLEAMQQHRHFSTFKALALLLGIAPFGSSIAFQLSALRTTKGLKRILARPQVAVRLPRWLSPPVLQSSADPQGNVDRTVSASPEDLILNVDAKGDDNLDEDVLGRVDPLIQLQQDSMQIEAAEAAVKESTQDDAADANTAVDGIDAVDALMVEKGVDMRDGDQQLPITNESSAESADLALKYNEALLEEDTAASANKNRKHKDYQEVQHQDDKEQIKDVMQEQKIQHMEKGQVQDEEQDGKEEKKQVVENKERGQSQAEVEDEGKMQRRWFGFEPSGIFSPAYEGTLRYVSADWIQNLKRLPTSLTLKRIRSPLLFNFFVTCVTCLVNHFFGPVSSLPALPHQLSGSVLSLLLVFRNNNAYTRFWEARTQWGKVKTECRELAALSTMFMTPKQALPMLGLISAYPHVMMNYLKGERDMKMVKRLVNEQEAEALKVVLNQPQYVLTRMRMLSFAAVNAGVDVRFRDLVIQRVCALGDTVSNCERIFNTPIPLAYSGHLSRFLTIYLSTLPIVLISFLGWKTLPVMAILCWALLGVKEIGNMIEEPFSAIDDETGRALLPMKEICRTIRMDVRAIAATAQIAQKFNAPTITSSNPSFRDNLPEGLRDLLQMFDQDSQSGQPLDGDGAL